ncbi:MAG: hypothetical protein Q7S65_04845 [Nanoarchaeota archaeon]|nr:hypothetical protein [Nanoarchaeota archaeon]
MSNSKPYALPVLASTAAAMLLGLFFKPDAWMDVVIAIGGLTFLYFFDRKKEISHTSFFLLLTTFVLNPLGVFWLYTQFVSGILGYDKVVHFTSSLVATFVLLEIDRKKRYGFVLLIVLGMGTVVELGEFVGTYYFGIDKGGILAVGDTLPSIKSDLQRFDTQFDFVFNLLGTIVGGFAAFVRQRAKNPKA